MVSILFGFAKIYTKVWLNIRNHSSCFWKNENILYGVLNSFPKIILLFDVLHPLRQEGGNASYGEGLFSTLFLFSHVGPSTTDSGNNHSCSIHHNSPWGCHRCTVRCAQPLHHVGGNASHGEGLLSTFYSR